ncbi:MAG: PD40 domain-containing protein [Ignavibacteriales bacterium]|nr:PD40 domain-containing protein [Ignavibacteriales bacterium]
MHRGVKIFLLIIFLTPSIAFSQFSYFGRNKVQYTSFDWQLLKTDHFDIYYYTEMKELSEIGAAYAEESYKILQEKFSFNISSRIPLIFYSTHLHFQQTNTTPGLVPEGVGGFFEFMKGRVVIPYTGSTWDFKHVIRHELVHVFMYGKINRLFSNHRMPQDRLPPLWFVEGLAEYWSIDWDTQAEMVLRDATLSGYIVPLESIDKIYGSYLMYKEGQAILKFISHKYGEDKILQLMENFWQSNSFEDIISTTLGVDYKIFDEEWIYALKKEYYPLLKTSDQPSGASSVIVGDGFNLKPVYYEKNGKREIYFIGNHTGYTNIYRINLDSALKNLNLSPDLVINGEQTDEFEAFHPFQNKLSISKDGILAFVTKSGDRDVLHLYDINLEKKVETFRFKDLIVLGSCAFSPEGNKIAFSAIDMSGANDLYVWDLQTLRLEKLTNDFYDDREPSWLPDGKQIVFASDRGPFGDSGKYNLFKYNLSDGEIYFVNQGNYSCSSPQYSDDGKFLIFTSDADGARNIWMMMSADDPISPKMRKVTEFTTGAFDPAWINNNLIFVGFEDFSFKIRMVENLENSFEASKEIRAVSNTPISKPWKLEKIKDTTETQSPKYAEEYSLDVAQSQIATDPVFGTWGGAYLSMSDLLGNEQYNFLVYNTAQSTDELLSSFNVAISRLSLHKRANYAFGIYRFSGRRYDLTDPDLYYFEKVFGGYYSLNYPLSKFKRIAVTTSISHSEKDITLGLNLNLYGNNIDYSRRALFLSNSISFTHDNSLWGPSGPLDGSRYNLTLAYTSDIQYSHANYYSVILDYRHYFRIGLMSAYAMRYWLFYNDGQEARRFFMGGSWDLRGYPRWSLRGEKLWLTSHELRFPLIDEVKLRFPFTSISFFGIRGALFADAGNAWDEHYFETLGAVGGGIRLNLGNVIVFRYDIGKRVEENLKRFQSGLFYQFFFGWDF